MALSVAVASPVVIPSPSSHRSTDVMGSGPPTTTAAATTGAGAGVGDEHTDGNYCSLEDGRGGSIVAPRRVVVASFWAHYGFETRWWLDVISFIVLGTLTLLVNRVSDLQPDHPYFFERDPAVSDRGDDFMCRLA